ncbi:MAG: hypothetical protein WB562_18330 [Candidatus Sulfotelmatobacter sp.]
MQGKNKEHWEELCAQAAVEQDGKKLLELVKQINDMLEAKERRLGVVSTLTIPCPTCGAEAGERCKLVTGELRSEPHRDRRVIAKDQS